MSYAGNLEHACGRLIVGKVASSELSAEERKSLRSGIVSGVTFFKDNAQDAEQLLRLVFDIRSDLKQAGFDRPLITVDQEGGAVQRFDHVLSPLPSFMALAAAKDLKQLAQVTEVSARQLKHIGVNCLLSPVLDLCLNAENPIINSRSFGDNGYKVGQLGAVVAKTLQANNILAVGKHFPGHGSTKEDSHLCLAVNHADAQSLWQNELVPFKECLPYLPAMLTAHVWLPAIDHEPLPASLSYKITHNLLRQYLQFDRLIITDDLLMKGITEKWGLVEACVMALEAGADQLLVCGNQEEIFACHQGLVNACKSGRISQARLSEALRHTDEALNSIADNYDVSESNFKDKLVQLEKLITEGSEKTLKASTSAVCLVRGHLPSVKSGKWLVVAPGHPRYKLNLFERLQAKLAGHANLELTEVRYPLNADEQERKLTLDRLDQYDLSTNCIFLTFRTGQNPGQKHLADSLRLSFANHFLVACDTPYDIEIISDWQNCLCTFDPSDLAMEALADILAGKAIAKGSMPLGLPALSPENIASYTSP